MPRTDIDFNVTLAYSALGGKYGNFTGDVEERPGDYDWTARWWSVAETLLAGGKLRAHPQEVRRGALDAITHGLEDLKAGKVSGKKLVYTLGE